MLAAAERMGTYQLGSADYSTVAIGPDAVTERCSSACVHVAPGRRARRAGAAWAERTPPRCPTARCRSLAAQRDSAPQADRVDELMRRHNAFRGAVLQLGHERAPRQRAPLVHGPAGS